MSVMILNYFASFLAKFYSKQRTEE